MRRELTERNNSGSKSKLSQIWCWRGDAREDLRRRLGNGVRLAWGQCSRAGIVRVLTIGRGEDRGMSVLNSYRWRSGQREKTNPGGGDKGLEHS